MSADADARCRICGLDDTEEEDLIVICEGCEVAVHQVRAHFSNRAARFLWSVLYIFSAPSNLQLSMMPSILFHFIVMFFPLLGAGLLWYRGRARRRVVLRDVRGARARDGARREQVRRRRRSAAERCADPTLCLSTVCAI